jgi:hypothetical protein
MPNGIENPLSTNPNSFPQNTGKPLPQSMQHKYEAEFGADLSKVNVHESHVPTLMGAQAYTDGNDIHFPPGGHSPYSPEGEKLLAHELAHVVQQNGNPSGNESVFKSLFQEAEDMARKALDL